MPGWKTWTVLGVLTAGIGVVSWLTLDPIVESFGPVEPAAWRSEAAPSRPPQFALADKLDVVLGCLDDASEPVRGIRFWLDGVSPWPAARPGIHSGVAGDFHVRSLIWCAENLRWVRGVEPSLPAVDAAAETYALALDGVGTAFAAGPAPAPGSLRRATDVFEIAHRGMVQAFLSAQELLIAQVLERFAADAGPTVPWYAWRVTVRLARLVWTADADLAVGWDRDAMDAAIIATEAALDPLEKWVADHPVESARRTPATVITEEGRTVVDGAKAFLARLDGPDAARPASLLPAWRAWHGASVLLLQSVRGEWKLKLQAGL